ncbi:MAG TPA: FAD-dependent monooxygenase [Saprospiraceae bacterium]|nr:FAD-dependent monooxygenase [Saprospiraceae bacterium]
MKSGIIIGAGIGGLTTAIALFKKGFNIEIYEQAKELNEIGAGIWVAPNGLKVFEQLGIAHEIISAGHPLHKISVTDIHYNPISIIDGQVIRNKYSFNTVAIHRGRLQKILASHIPEGKLFLQKRMKSYHHTSNRVIAEFEDGSTKEADFIIAADGIKSHARLQMTKSLDLRYSGQTCWRFVTNFDLPQSEENNMYELWSDKKGLRVGYSKISEQQVYVFITHYAKSGEIDQLVTLKNDLLKLCNEFPPLILDLIESTSLNHIIRTDLFDFKPIRQWTDGRVALMGDAAHATTPNLGQGACQAIEDAQIIADSLSQEDHIPAALKLYAQRRIKKAHYITNTSWRFAQITNTTGFVKSILKYILRITPTVLQKRQFDKMYSLDI